MVSGISKKKHPDVTVLYTDAKSDPALQIAQLETMITQGVDAIAISPADQGSLRAILPTTNAANIPVTLINEYPEPDILELVQGFVGTNSTEAGAMQGEWLEKNVPEGGNIGILMGMLVHDTAQKRTAGLREFMKDKPQFKIVAEAEGQWDRNKALQIAENWLQSDSNISIFACNNDEMAIGAALACRSMDVKDKDVYIVGVDGTSDGLEFLGNGLDMTLYQNPFVIGYDSMQQLYDILTGQPSEKIHWISHQIIVPENKAKYQAEQDQAQGQTPEEDE